MWRLTNCRSKDRVRDRINSNNLSWDFLFAAFQHKLAQKQITGLKIDAFLWRDVG